MKRIAVLVTFLGLAATGCGTDVTADLEKLADRACACKDAACAQTVLDDFVSFVKANKNGVGDQEKAAKAATKMTECALKGGADPAKLMSAVKDLM
jgi:hypothetical protein